MSTGSPARPVTACRPPKPPPTMTTRWRPSERAASTKLAPARQREREALRSAIKHGPPAAGAGRVDVGRGVVDEQDRLRRRHAHARLRCGEEHAVWLAHAQRRGIDDLVEVRAKAGLLAQIGDAMVFLVGGG